MSCPSDEILAAFVDGVLPEARAGGVREHLADCARCQADYLAMAEEIEGAAVRAEAPGEITRLESVIAGVLNVSVGRGRRIAGLRAWSVAASLLAVAGVGLVAWRSESPRVRPVAYAMGGEPLRKGGEVRVDLQASVAVSDGSRITLAGGSAIRPEAPAPGERASLYLLCGEVFLDVARAPGAFVVRTDEGEMRVVGTAFRVRVGDVPAPAGDVNPGRYTTLVVTEGSVHARTPRAPGVDVGVGQRAYLFAAGNLVVWQEPAASAQAVRETCRLLRQSLEGPSPDAQGAARHLDWIRDHAAAVREHLSRLPVEDTDILRRYGFSRW